MRLDITIPEVGESVKEAVLAQWFRRDGDQVRKDEILFLLETDKVTLEIVAQADGILHILEPQGKTVAIGSVIGFLETETMAEATAKPDQPDTAPAASHIASQGEEKASEPPATVAATVGSGAPPQALPPSVRRMVAAKGLDVNQLQGSGPGGRITKGDVLLYLERTSPPAPAVVPDAEPATRSRQPAVQEGPMSPSIPDEPMAPADAAAPACGPFERITRAPMSRIRLRIAERLLEARQQTATLTTFNEIDMSALQAERARFKEAFRAKHGVSLGIMSFFIKATTAALQEFPELNASIEGKDVVYHDYYHIGVAIGAERGLVVPVIRHADHLSFAQLEQAIVDFVQKIKENRLELTDLAGGTFSITNGGIYGSLLSTPILNMPQSGILGMHKIEDRPVAISGEVVIRPMMYVALSYDHRLIDGRQAVTFLRRIKETIENPERIMLEV
ncbi:MAG TPA: dihydrolipoamide succinyltransferase [Syntrophobacteraceae bacterium]|nr:dihydrolipoamide succinyltransferase [Syntrophobacteraceae bacterium]